MNSCEIDRSSDGVVINNINPFVFGSDAMNLPGAWSADYDFSFYNNKPVEDESNLDEDKEISPICKYASTAGYRTIDSCKPSQPNCPMSRPLLPERDINPGMWYYNRLDADAARLQLKLKSGKKLSCSLVYALLVFLIILLILKI